MLRPIEVAKKKENAVFSILTLDLCLQTHWMNVEISSLNRNQSGLISSLAYCNFIITVHLFNVRKSNYKLTVRIENKGELE
jgi:hypothetical protein